MTTAATLPTPAHQLSSAKPNISAPKSQDVNHQGLPIPRGPVTASLSFYHPPADGSKPWNYIEKPVDGPQKNYSEEFHDVTIDDIRGQEDKFTMDNNAFSVISNVPSEEYKFADDEQIKRIYYPEVERLLLENVPGAHKVFLFDHTIRRSTPDAHRAPVTRVHIDQTPSSAAQRVKLHLPDEADQLLQGRYRIINVWRPLNGPVMAHPLAVADSSFVQDEDLVAVEHRYPDRNGEIAVVKHNPNHKWYYWSGMKNEDRLFLKCFDSDEVVGPWGRVPHSAFADPRTPKGAIGRESIEVRALVFG